jgi:hypothetical protein
MAAVVGGMRMERWGLACAKMQKLVIRLRDRRPGPVIKFPSYRGGSLAGTGRYVPAICSASAVNPLHTTGKPNACNLHTDCNQRPYAN